MSHTFTLPIRQPNASETVSFRVDWGDSTSEIFTFDGNTWSTQDFSHYYSNNNLKTIKIHPPNGEKFGKYWGFGHANATNSAAQMSHITKWGGFEFSSAGGSFKDCINLDIDSNLTGTPAINYPNSLHSAFSGCTAFHPEPNQLINWDTSAAETLYETFYGCSNFNSSVSNWNVSNVTNTTRMFADCVVFNQSMSGWNNSGNGWQQNTGNLVTATAMFRGASSFNQSLSDWNVSKLVWIEQMFKNATNFASNVFVNYDANGGSASLQEVFMGTKFNAGQITTWDVSTIMFFGGVFEDNAHFNQDIGDWDVGGAVGGFSNMFKGATSFNKDISEWDTSSASNFSGMFQGASSFNQNINTKSAITKHGSTYNPWTIKTSSGPNNLNNMLHGAAAFDQDISDWNMTHISSADDLLEGTDLSAENAAAINDSGTGWPSQSGVDSDAVAASQAAVQASGTIPVITSHSAQGSTYTYTNPENTQTTVNVVATGSPVPTLSLANNSAEIDKDKFTLVDNGDGTGTLKLTNAPNFESPTDDGWAGQNTYAVYVHATNAIGSANAFFNFNVTDVADVAAPDITGLQVDSVGSTTATFSWAWISNAAGYDYQVSTNSSFSGIMASGTQSSNMIDVTGLNNQTAYWFRVRVNGGGTGAVYELDSNNWTTTNITTTGIPPAITAPTSFTINNAENTQEVVALTATGTPTPSWSLDTSLPANSNNLDASKFTLVDNGNGTATLKLTSAPDYDSPTDSDGNNTYFVRPSASNSAGASAANFQFNVYDVQDEAAPTINTLSLSNATSDGFVASWNSVGSGYTYHYQVATNSSFSNIVAENHFYSNTSITRTGHDEDTTYYFRVKAKGGGLGSTYEVDSPSWDVDNIDTLPAFNYLDNISSIGDSRGMGHSYYSMFLQGGPDYVSYVNGEPYLLNHYNSGYSWTYEHGILPSNSRTKYEFGKSHYEQAGHSEGRVLNNRGGLTGTAIGYGQNYKGLLLASIVGGDYYDPQVLFSNSDLVKIWRAPWHAFFQKTDGTIWRTGSSTGGSGGTGNTSQTILEALLATEIPTNTDDIWIGNSRTWFRKADGTLWGLGSNYYASLGVPATGASPNSGTEYLTPVEIPISNVCEVIAGGWHTLFLKTDGTLWAVGNNDVGQFGNGISNEMVDVPEQIFSGVSQASAGMGTTFVVKTDGSLWSSGSNLYGRNGLGGNDESPHGDYATSFLPVPGFPANPSSGIVKVASGLFNTAVLRDDGTVWMCGRGNYQESAFPPGQPVAGNAKTFVHMNWVSGVEDISLGYKHLIFQKSDGSVWSQGNNGSYQLAQYNTDPSYHDYGRCVFSA